VRLRDKAEIVAACVVIPPALEMFAATKTLDWVRSLRPRKRPSPPPESLASAVDRVLMRAPGPWHHTCLRRAVTIAALLRRAGREPEVIFGVRRTTDGALEAHAWLRCDGIDPYLEPPTTDRFEPLTRAAP
jgi:hypothetical protein